MKYSLLNMLSLCCLLWFPHGLLAQTDLNQWTLPKVKGSTSVRQALRRPDRVVKLVSEPADLEDTIGMAAGLEKLTRLRVLHLSYSDVHLLRRNLPFLSSLQVLSLSENGAKHFPLEICRFPHLKWLSVFDNPLEDCIFPASRLGELEYLNLSYNNLTVFPDSVVLLPALRFLSLTHTGISNLPQDWTHLGAVEEIYLQANDLGEIPPSLLMLPRLHTLHLMGNNLRSLPDIEAGKCALESLLLYENDLTEFPLALCRMPELTVLNLSDNHIRKIPDEIVQMKNLQLLLLTGNPLGPGEAEKVKRLLPDCDVRVD